jgi:hypothetical protein
MTSLGFDSGFSVQHNAVLPLYLETWTQRDKRPDAAPKYKQMPLGACVGMTATPDERLQNGRCVRRDHHELLRVPRQVRRKWGG